MSLRMELVMLIRQKQNNLSELCRRFGISRKTAYKWLRRQAEHGREGLADRSLDLYRNRSKCLSNWYNCAFTSSSFRVLL